MATVTRETLRAHRQTHDKSNSWWMADAKGIPLCRVCLDCQQVAQDSYPPVEPASGSFLTPSGARIWQGIGATGNGTR